MSSTSTIGPHLPQQPTPTTPNSQPSSQNGKVQGGPHHHHGGHKGAKTTSPTKPSSADQTATNDTLASAGLDTTV